MTPLTLSRIRLRARRGEVLSAVAPLLVPDDAGRRPAHAHRVLWLMFQDIADAARDFLWRDEGEGRFIVLSHRPPSDPHALFEIESKEFAPDLRVGDRLRMMLRANPTRASKAALDPEARAARQRGKRVDVVMHALKDVPQTDWDLCSGRAFERDRLVREAGTAWLTSIGERSGFAPAGEIEVGGYVQIPFERRRGRPAGFSQLEFAGEIEVRDPDRFLDRLTRGFGSAKAFGCGLMLIRRA